MLTLFLQLHGETIVNRGDIDRLEIFPLSEKRMEWYGIILTVVEKYEVLQGEVFIKLVNC